jgi:hypothetical protein
MIHVLAFIGLLWVFSVFVVCLSLIGFWIWDRRARPVTVKLARARVRR